jgi:myo-inositol-1(or 4)-monophosphatase
MNYEKITDAVAMAATKTGSWLKDLTGKIHEDLITSKGRMDFVTEIDKESEKRLIHDLCLILPEAGFIAEEGTETRRGKDFNWIIDPIDGTTNFIHGVFPFSISIGLMEGTELVSGVIYDPLHGECFYASRGSHSMLNGKPIRVSQRNHLGEALLATGFPYNDFSLLEPYMASMRELMACTHGIRRLGSAAMDLAFVACGRYDAFWEYHLKPWDVAAGTLIIKQAGGMVSDFSGGEDFLFGETFVATNGLVQSEFLAVLNKHFGKGIESR